MSGLLFLCNDDFQLAKGSKGNIMCSSIPGYSLILFYSPSCKFCQDLLPVFRSLPGSIGGCQFGMVNVSINKQVIKMSRETIAPVNYVPFIVLYLSGRPFMKYQGPSDADSIKRFVLEVAQKMESKQKFSSEQIEKPRETKIPSFTIGHPLWGMSCSEDGQCTYLPFNEAYV